MVSNQHTGKSEPSASSNVFNFRRLQRLVDGSFLGRKTEHSPTLPHEVSNEDPKKSNNWVKNKIKKLQKRNTSRRVTIEILPADVLVKIFDAYRLDPLIYSQLGRRPWKWQRLAHVCKTWRSVLLTSPRYLGLQLFFADGIPIREVLSSWPVLPIVMQYVEAPGSGALTHDQDNIIALLELPTRLRSVQLTVTAPLLEKVTALMQQTFSVLEYLYLSTPPGLVLVLPSEVGGGMPRLRALRLVGTALPALPQLLLSAHDLVSLQLEELSSVGYTLEALIICLPMMTRLETLRIHFLSPTFRPVLISTDQPLREFSVLPVLNSIEFRGTSEYLESLLSRISAPLLESFHIDFFNQLIFDTPQLSRFIRRTEMQRSHATIRSSVADISITLTHLTVSHQLSLRILCKQLDWQIPAMAEVCDRLSPTLADVEQLKISAFASFTDEQDDMDLIHSEILEIFRSFRNVKRLCVTEPSLSLVSRALRLVTGELAIVVLPELQEIQTERYTELVSARISLVPFISARQFSTRPVVVNSRTGGGSDSSRVRTAPQKVQSMKDSDLPRLRSRAKTSFASSSRSHSSDHRQTSAEHSRSSPRRPTMNYPARRPLNSTVRQALPEHSKFRILVVGKSGSGKSSLIKAVFKVDVTAPGKADINLGFRPEDNRYLIVHECSGLDSQAGDSLDLQTIRDFISYRTDVSRSPSERLHAVWICVPVSDAIDGKLGGGVEEILSLRNVPAVLVFTKFDVVVSQIRHDSPSGEPQHLEGARARAHAMYEDSCRRLFHKDPRDVPAEIVSENSRSIDLIDNLIVTTDRFITDSRAPSARSGVRGAKQRVAAVPLAWSAALRMCHDIKIQATIEVGRTRYWRSLWSNLDFADQTLKDCVNIIHVDIVEIWNLNDETKYLLSNRFKAKMSHLVGDLAGSASASSGSDPNRHVDDYADWVYDNFRGSQENVRCVMGYIVDLTVILDGIFRTAAGNMSPKDALQVFDRHVRSGHRDAIHRDIRSFITEAFATRYAVSQKDLVLERTIDLIKQYCVPLQI